MGNLCRTENHRSIPIPGSLVKSASPRTNVAKSKYSRTLNNVSGREQELKHVCERTQTEILVRVIVFNRACRL